MAKAKKATKKAAPKKATPQKVAKAPVKKAAPKVSSPRPQNGDMAHNTNASAIRKFTHKAHEIKEEAAHENEQPAEPTNSGNVQMDNTTAQDVSDDKDGVNSRKTPESEEKKEEIEGPLM